MHKLSMIIVISICALVFLFWLAGLLFANDFSVPSKNMYELKNVLLIFPHADDEVLNASGVIHRLSQNKSKVTLVILTKGEKGTPDAHYDEKLKEIRTKEAQESSKILGVTQLLQEDFGDGELVHKRPEVQQHLAKIIHETQPDLIITYDLAGLYGHPDHIVTSEIITELHKQNAIPLWYVSFPKKVLNMIHLPEHMAKDQNFKEKRAYPTHKVFVGSSIFAKMTAISAYKSQKDSFKSSLPIKQVPGNFFYSMQMWEYFSEKIG